MSNTPLVIERTFDAPATKVWQAITDHRQMKEWYFDLADFKPEVGFFFEFSAGAADKEYLHRCEVTEVEPGKKLTYSWKYQDYPGESFVTFELFPDGDKTRLVLTHRGLESFPSHEDKNFGVESFTAGWTQIIGTNLKQFVEK